MKSYRAVIGLAVLLTAAATVAARQQKPTPSERKTIAELASESGSYVGRLSYPTQGGPATIDELVRSAELIVVSRAEQGRCVLVNSGRTIATIYDLAPEQVLKGTAPSELRVALLGGRVEFAGGNSAQQNTVNFLKPNPGTLGVWFLSRARPQLDDEREGRYEPTGGPLGFYTLDRTQHHGKSITSAGSPLSPLSRSLAKEGLDQETFLARVRESVKRQEK